MRNLLYLLLILLLLAGSAAVWSWHLATRLPDWYLEREPTAGPLDRDAAVGLLERLGRELLGDAGGDFDRMSERLARLRAGTERSGMVEIGEKELEALLVGRLAREPDGRALLKATRAVRVTIGEGGIEAGAVVDPARLPEGAAGGAAATLRRLARTVPAMGGRELYLGLRGTPGVRNGNLLLDRSTRVLLGGLTLPAAAAAKAFATGGNDLRRGVELDLGHLRLESIELEPGKLRARLLPTP